MEENSEESMAELVSTELKQLYKENIYPLEIGFKFDLFKHPPLLDADFDAKPMVLLLGEVSTGKTAFVRYLVGHDFETMSIGNLRQTTNKFTVLTYGAEERCIPGGAVIVNSSMPFQTLSEGNNGVVNHFQVVETKSPTLRDVMIVDTPPVLSGRKHERRGYSYGQAVEWFAQRASRIFLFFDHSTLEPNAEFEALIVRLKKQRSRIRLVLNKADELTEPELVQAYGSLKWNLCSILKSPEEAKVYVTHFGAVHRKNELANDFEGEANDTELEEKNYLNEHRCLPLFEKDSEKLVNELGLLPSEDATNKINHVIKRAKDVELHVRIITELKKRLPAFFGKKSSQQDIIRHLEDILNTVAGLLHVKKKNVMYLATQENKSFLLQEPLSKYPKFNQKKIDKLNAVVTQGVPQLLLQLNGGNTEKVRAELSRLGVTGRSGAAKKGRLKSTESQRGRSKSMMSIMSTGSKISTTGKFFNGMFSKVRSMSKSSRKDDGFAQEPDSDRKKSRFSFFRPTRSSAGPSLSGTMRRPKAPSRTSLVEQDIPEMSDRELALQESLEEEMRENAKRKMMLKKNRSNNRTGLFPIASSPKDENWGVPYHIVKESSEIFHEQELLDGKLTGQSAFKAFSQFNMPKKMLAKIWKLVDIDGAQELDEEEFALAVYLIRKVQAGEPLPDKLSEDLIPPSHRI